MIKRIVSIIVFLILFIQTSSSQEPKISIEFKGYGRTTREVYFTVRNIGNTPLSNITISVDGVEHRPYHSRIGPGMAVQIFLNLNPGEHFVEVSTLEGASDSINVSIPSIQGKTVTTQREIEEREGFIEKYRFLASLLLLTCMVIVVWLLLKKPKIR